MIKNLDLPNLWGTKEEDKCHLQSWKCLKGNQKWDRKSEAGLQQAWDRSKASGEPVWQESGKSKFHREAQVPQWRAGAKENGRSESGWNEGDTRWYRWLRGKKTEIVLKTLYHLELIKLLLIKTTLTYCNVNSLKVKNIYYQYWTSCNQ